MLTISFTPAVIQHNQRLLNSYRKWTGHELIDRSGSADEDAIDLFNAPFVLVSHGTEVDPIFDYGNRKALELFEMTWDDLIKMPSRNSAEAVHQAQREQFMEKVTRNGYVTDYSGIRISSSGKRFQIRDAVVWNVLDETENYCGQAATFDKWEYV